MPSILDDLDSRLERKKKPKYIKSMTMTILEGKVGDQLLKVKLPNWEKGEFFIFASVIPERLRLCIQEGAKFTFSGNSRMHWWAEFAETIRGWKYVEPKKGKKDVE